MSKSPDGTQRYGVSIFVDKEMFDRQMAEINARFDKLGQTASDSGDAIDRTFRKIGAGVAAYFAVGQLKSFAGEVINVRSEFQKLEVSFSSLLGSSGKGKKMFEDITAFATSTPMLEKDLAQAAQTLLGFNIEAEKVMPLLQQLGDVSMGDSQKFQSLTLAFAQASSTGKLMGQDLLQMINAGFNPLAEISRTTGKSMSELKDEMSKGNITVEMLEGAFRSATSEGGKFNGMLESQSKTLAGAVSNLEGAVQKLMNDIGTKIEEPVVNAVNDLYELTNKLAESFDDVAGALTHCIGAFGGYKAACMLVSVANNIAAASAAGHSIKTQLLRKEIQLLRTAQALLNKTMLMNPYVLVGAAAGALAVAFYKTATATTSATEAQELLNTVTRKYEAEVAKENAQIDELFDKLRKAESGTDEYKSAKDNIISQYGQYLQGLNNEIATLQDVEGAYKAVTAAASEAARARAMQTAKEAAYTAYGDSYSGNIDKLFDALKKRKGGEIATKQIRELRKELRETGTISGQTIKNIQAKLAGTFDYGNSKAWLTGLKNAQKVLDDELNDISAKFGENSKVKAGGTQTNTPKPTNGQTRKELSDAVRKTKANYEKLVNNSKADAAETEKARKDYEEAKKKWDESVYGKQEKDNSKANSTANKAVNAATRAAKEQASQQQKYNDVLLEQEEELSKKRSQIALQTEQARIDQMKDGAAKTLRQIELDYQKELAAIELAEDDILRAQTEAARKRWEVQNPKAGEKGQNWENTGYWQWQKETGGAKPSDEEQEFLSERIKAAKAKYDSALGEQLSAERQAMLAYVKEYGSMEQQRLAIAEEYEKKIAGLRKAGASGWEVASIEDEIKAKLREIDTTDIFRQIDWDNIFSDLAIHTKGYLVGVRNQLQNLISSGALTSIEDIEKVQSRLDELNKEISNKGGLFSFTGSRTQEHRRLAARADTAEDNRRNALGKESAAFNELDRLHKAGAAAGELAVAEARLAKARENVISATNKARQAADAAKRTSAQAMADWFSDAQEFITQKGLDELPGLLDKIGLGSLGDKVSSGLSAFNNASGSAADFASGNYIGALSKGISAIADFGSALGIGGADYSEWEAAVAKYSSLCDVWEDVLKDQRDVIDKARGVYETMEAYNKAQDTIQKQVDAQRAMGAAALGSGSSAGSHSIHYRMWQGSYKSAYGRTWNAVADEIGISSLYDLLDMSAEQLKDIRAEYSDLWAAMDDDFRNVLETMIEYREEAEQLATEVIDKITNTSFSDMRDSYLDSLSDMESDTEDFVKSIEDMFFSAMIDSFVLGDDFNEWLEKWQKRYADAVKNNDKEALAALVQEAVDMRSQKIDERNQLAAEMGYDRNASQSATANAVRSITADQADQLIGRITAVQIAVERSIMFSEELTASAKDISARISAGFSLVEENNSLTQRCAQHLESISEYTSVLPAMSEELTRLRTITETRL
ncbi:MAG: tape measure protein [Bacteroidales bacterium]|nr:tape measure protein [Bacteroidales bacterium]MCM1148176.1 tape measure protein [Bacteroidales bacterium]MCM1207097.1 tape measure protein [Bacillota bacterium]MCM1510849.1 tape measure protein [Clostridium sp.]